MAGTETKRLNLRCGTTRAVADVDLSIPKGAFFALPGPSGCGTTGPLRLLRGLRRPGSRPSSRLARRGGREGAGRLCRRALALAPPGAGLLRGRGGACRFEAGDPLLSVLPEAPQGAPPAELRHPASLRPGTPVVLALTGGRALPRAAAEATGAGAGAPAAAATFASRREPARCRD